MFPVLIPILVKSGAYHREGKVCAAGKIQDLSEIFIHVLGQILKGLFQFPAERESPGVVYGIVVQGLPGLYRLPPAAHRSSLKYAACVKGRYPAYRKGFGRRVFYNAGLYPNPVVDGVPGLPDVQRPGSGIL
jgi:hypothetical protein